MSIYIAMSTLEGFPMQEIKTTFRSYLKINRIITRHVCHTEHIGMDGCMHASKKAIASALH